MKQHNDATDLRHHTGLTQQALAEALGLSRRTVQNYERDGAPVWYALAVERLAQITTHKPPHPSDCASPAGAQADR